MFLITEPMKPMNVTWIDGNPDSDNRRPLGYMSLEPLNAHSKRADLNQQSTFIVTDQEVRLYASRSHLLTECF